MTHHPAPYDVQAAHCPHCKNVHLIILYHGNPVYSVPMTRNGWAKLLGQYGEVLAGKVHHD